MDSRKPAAITEQETTSGPWVDYAEASRYTSLPISSLRKLVMSRDVPYRKWGPRKVLFSLRELDAWIAERHKRFADQGE